MAQWEKCTQPKKTMKVSSFHIKAGHGGVNTCNPVLGARQTELESSMPSHAQTLPEKTKGKATEEATQGQPRAP